MAVNKIHVISMRLTAQEYQPFAEMIEQAGTGKSHFFRTLLLSKATRITVAPKMETPRDYKTCLFYMNKASNNINQIARRLNTDYKSGILNEKVYNLCLNNLITIKNILEGAISYDHRIRRRE